MIEINNSIDSALRKIFSFYSYVYAALALISLAQSLLGFSLMLFSSDSSEVEIATGQQAALSVLLSSVLFFLWFKNFKFLSNSDFFLPHKQPLYFLNFSKLMFITFSVELIDFLYSRLYLPGNITLKAITDLSDPNGVYWYLNFYLDVLSILKEMDFLLTPRTTGLATLLISFVFFALGQQGKKSTL